MILSLIQWFKRNKNNLNDNGTLSNLIVWKAVACSINRARAFKDQIRMSDES